MNSIRKIIVSLRRGGRSLFCYVPHCIIRDKVIAFVAVPVFLVVINFSLFAAELSASQLCNSCRYLLKIVLVVLFLINAIRFLVRQNFLRRLAVKHNFSLCTRCLYNIGSSTTNIGRCPECGIVFSLVSTRRRWFVFVYGRSVTCPR